MTSIWWNVRHETGRPTQRTSAHVTLYSPNESGSSQRGREDSSASHIFG